MIAGYTGDADIQIVAGLLIAAIFGFFVLNWPMGRIFLGDAGAYGIGHILAWLGIVLVARNASVAGYAILLILFWPVCDTLFSICRRLGTKRATDQPDRLPGEPYADKLVLDHARERVELLEIALRTAEQGVFLGDGYNDSPNSEQQASELAKVIGTLEAELAEDKAREAAYAGRLSRERVRVNGLSGGDLAAPVNGLFWEVLEADGVTVQRGDPVLRLVNCDAMMVTLSVTERIYNTLAIGQDAEFRLSGSSQVLPATVSRLAGSGAATVYEHLAVAPSQKHLERYDVALNVPGLGQGSESACAIGRTGRAFFERRPLDWLRSVFD